VLFPNPKENALLTRGVGNTGRVKRGFNDPSVSNM
jgi:hypothetical protein